jgi:glycerol uptake facilitator-like aquaporin
MLLRLQSITAGLLYMVAQCLGAIFGAFILWGCNASLTDSCDSLDAAGLAAQLSGVCDSSKLPNGEGYGPAFGLGANSLDIRVSTGCAFLIEIMGTYLLVFTVLQAAVHTKSTGGNAVPIAIGWAVLVAHLILIPYTGCGINPARSLGPMVVDSIGGLNKWERGWWVFYTAPFVGSILATATYKFIFERVEKAVAGKAKKDDDVAGGDDDDDVEGQIPQTYDEDAKNTGEEAVTDDAVPHAYE